METQKKRRKVVVIGGGFAGLATVNAMKGANLDITVIDKSNHHLFQPLLYQVATAALSPGDIAAPIRAIFGNNKNIRVILGEVNNIDTEAKKLHLVNETEIPFDQLVIAPGAQYNYFGNKHWKENAPSLKTISDALKIRERILLSLEQAEQLDDPEKRRPYLTYVIIGGGPTGVETAGAIAEIAGISMRRNYRNIKEKDINIYLVEAAPGILNGFSDPLGDKGQKMLEKLGVKVLLNSPVARIEKDEVFLKVGSIKAANIIWAAGIKAPALLNDLKAEKDNLGRIYVKEDLSVPGFPDVYVIGDSANFKDEMGKPLPALASVAKQQGQYLGELLSTDPWQVNHNRPFKYLSKGTMATVGRAKAVVQFRGLKVSGFFAWVLWCTVHLLLLVGFRNRWRVFSEWIWNYFTFKRGVQLITDRTNCHNCSPSPAIKSGRRTHS